MNFLRRLMYGRYGSDKYGLFLLILSVVVNVLALFLPVPGLGFLSLIPLAFCIYRMFSKNIERRRAENYAYLMLAGKVKSWFKNIAARLKSLKTHRYFTCPECKKKLRVPKGKGKISITCPGCKAKFTRKT